MGDVPPVEAGYSRTPLPKDLGSKLWPFSVLPVLVPAVDGASQHVKPDRQVVPKAGIFRGRRR
jgi:hypothetical protein